jgi:hypothetical protein
LTNFSVDLLLYFSAAPYARFMAIESSLAAGGSVCEKPGARSARPRAAQRR